MAATPEFLPGEPHGQRSLVGHSPWGCTESNTTEATQRARSWALGPKRVGNLVLEQGLSSLLREKADARQCWRAPHTWRPICGDGASGARVTVCANRNSPRSELSVSTGASWRATPAARARLCTRLCGIPLELDGRRIRSGVPSSVR